MSFPKPPSEEQLYETDREELAQAFLIAGLQGNVNNISASAAFNLAEEFLAELKKRNDKP